MNSEENSSSLLRPNFDSTSSISFSEASSSNISSNSSSISTNSFDSKKIKRVLLNQPQKFKIIENESPSHAEWWRSFGFPAQLNENNKLERINGYISCIKCMHTQVYNLLSGTKRFKQHADKCFPSSVSSSTSISSSSSTQTTLNQMGFKKSLQFSENDVKIVKKLCAQWICGDIRPFSIVDDPGFRNVAQECIRLGATYGNVDVNDVFRGEKTISRHIICIADELRDQVKDMLSISLKEGSLTICPDYWTDCYKRISYLAVTATFVTDEYSYQSIDLFCRPFHFKKKTAELTLNALYKHLESFGIVSLANVNIVCDRGNTTATGLPMSIKVPTDITSHSESSSDESESSTDDDCNAKTALPVTQRKVKKKLKKPILCKHEAQIPTEKITVDQIPASAKRVLASLNQCKRIVKYVKKAGINKDIKENGGVTLHQSTIVRWLSMSNLLESVLKSFTTTKRLLLARKKQALTIDLDEITIKQLVLVLKPFKHTMTLIQTGNIPSLHMVLLSTITLKEALSSYKSLLNYKKCYCNTNENKKDNDKFDEDEEYELEGIKWFRERLLELLDDMIVLDVRHYCATMLHPKYRSLKSCSKEERLQCQQYIREQLKIIGDVSTPAIFEDRSEPAQKKMKLAADLFSRFEDDNSCDIEVNEGEEAGYESDEYVFNKKKPDELDKYMVMQIDKSLLTNNPLDFWKIHSKTFPLLSKLAKRIHSIPATSTGVERQFSSAGLIMNQRRTNINPEQIDNILLVRSLQKMNNS
ncbi:unnamed protein product [Rotaria sp. Silwood1]|nr:unnamed protein product [Rotaria sp. Silwood1]CAF4933600.1 unnamed protein product [Rotaria sp. Silwood1]